MPGFDCDLTERLIWDSCEWEKAMVPSRFAYHVTNVLRTDDTPPPWTELRCHEVYDPKWDRGLLGLSCVGFSTTLRRGELPLFSPFPIKGQRGAQHWRVNVPLDCFRGYSMWYCKNSDGFIKQRTMFQVRIILTNDAKASHFENDPGFKRLDLDKPNPFLYYDHLGRWYTNDFAIRDDSDNNGVNYWVNFAVLNDFPLRGCIWDSVKRDEKKRGGVPLTRDEINVLKFEQWAARRILERRNDE